jgi:hypothetical protein
MSVDITTDPVARALYYCGPAGIHQLAAFLEERGIKVDLPARLRALMASSDLTVRPVVMAGQSVELYALVGGSIG